MCKLCVRKAIFNMHSEWITFSRIVYLTANIPITSYTKRLADLEEIEEQCITSLKHLESWRQWLQKPRHLKPNQRAKLHRAIETHERALQGLRKDLIDQILYSINKTF